MGSSTMKRMRALSILTVLVALSGSCFAAEAAAPQARPKVCIDAQADDTLIKEFADRLKDAIAASDALSLAVATDSCSLELHVPGNLLRFQTAGGVMVSTVVIVTSSSGHYLSTSIAACQATDLRPCAARAVAAAKLAVLMTPNAAYWKHHRSGKVVFTIPPDQARDPQRELAQAKRTCEAQGWVYTLRQPPPHWSFSCEPPGAQSTAGATQ